MIHKKTLSYIHGILDSAYESTEGGVIKAAKAIYVDIRPEVIEISHKLHNPGERPAIIRFNIEI